MLNKTAKILIISETFKSNTGGGITLTNLFKGYPKDCLANAIDARETIKISSNLVCDNFYSLGSAEKKVIPPFSFLQKKSYSGRYFYTNKKKQTHHKSEGRSLREISISYFFRFLHFIGIYHVLYRYEISNNLGKWINDFKPDYIYTQLSNRELIIFSEKLIKLTGASLAIHIMDDWPSTISKNSLLKRFWHRKIDLEFKNLIDKADVLMSISEGMSLEYKKRYKKDFIPFHNPIEINQWIPYSKKSIVVDSQNIIVLYAGRIGRGTSESLLDLANAIEELKNEGKSITLKIQTTSVNSPIQAKLNKFSCVKFNPEVEYTELPKIFSAADILVMPIDFSQEGIEFLKYSMPTKASEYMISGTPILLYCNKEVSLYNDAVKYGWATTVTEKDLKKIKEKIMEILENENLRLKITRCAISHAKNNFDSNTVRNSFHKQFIISDKRQNNEF